MFIIRILGAGIPQTWFCSLSAYEESNAVIIFLIIWLRSSAGFLHHSSTLFVVVSFPETGRAFLLCPQAAWPPQVTQAVLSLGSLPLSACTRRRQVCAATSPTKVVFPRFFFSWNILGLFFDSFTHVHWSLYQTQLCCSPVTDTRHDSLHLHSLSSSTPSLTASPCFILRLCSYYSWTYLLILTSYSSVITLFKNNCQIFFSHSDLCLLKFSNGLKI